MNKAGILSLLIFTFSSIACLAQNSRVNSTSDFTVQKKKILQYLQTLVSDSMIITGQHCGNGNATEQGYNNYIDGLFRSTGKYPALIGLEYGYSKGNDLSFINSFALMHTEKGGLVTITWHADNPWVEGYNCRWNSVENKETINFTKLVKNAPDSNEKTSYRNELMTVGLALQELHEAGIVILWRPFHEMNGSWFWWGPDELKSPRNNKEFRMLWKDMYDTFTADMGLDNLIWIYSPIAASNWSAALDAFYPGNEMVDVNGVDIYSPKPEFKDYDLIKSLGKPVVVGEIGPVKETYGNFNALETLKQLRGKAAWFLQWSSWPNAKVAIVDNPNAREMMRHPSAVTLEDIDLH